MTILYAIYIDQNLLYYTFTTYISQVEGSPFILSYYISVMCGLSVFLKYKYLINHPVYIITFIHLFIHSIQRIKITKCIYLCTACMYVCVYDDAFPLHCPGPGYWLLSRRVVPPPQSDLWKLLLSGESTHTIRHEKGHHLIHISHTKINFYIHTYI